VNFVSIQNDLVDKRTDKTGEWILDSDEFNKWLESPYVRVLWCPGIRES
jgi:hypothetical protein